MKKISAILAVSALLFSACKSDFKLTSNWKEQMVVFGLLNQNDSVQYIRINKTFLGEGNAYTMAAVHDSMNYKFKLNVTVDEWLNGSFNRTFPVDTTSMIAQDPGPFANQPQVLYRIHTRGANKLNENAEYHLSITNPRTGYTVTGKTILVSGVDTSSSGSGNDIQITTPLRSTLSYNFYNLTFPFLIQYTTGTNGRLFQTILRFHYDEYYTNGNIVHRTIDRDFGEYLSTSPNGGESVNLSFSWNDFLNLFAALVTPDPGVYKRIYGNCDLIMTVGSDEFNTYMSVNQPVTSITGDKPTYTNLTNGLGLFSSRYVFDSPFYSKPLSNQTIDNSISDPRICALHFADSHGNVICP